MSAEGPPMPTDSALRAGLDGKLVAQWAIWKDR